MIESWELRDGPFIYFNILNLPFVDKSIKMAPLAQLNDGLLDIIVSFINIQCKQIQGNVGRCKLLKALLCQDKGDWF